ncbi:MAG: hypothetical protein WCY29_08890 [Novosphingobium sp.]
MRGRRQVLPLGTGWRVAPAAKLRTCFDKLRPSGGENEVLRDIRSS